MESSAVNASVYRFNMISNLCTYDGFSANQLAQLTRVVNIKNDTLKQLLTNNIFNSEISVNKIKYAIDLCENTEMYFEEKNFFFIHSDYVKGIYDLVEEYIKDITLNNTVEDDKAEIIDYGVFDSNDKLSSVIVKGENFNIKERILMK